MAQKLNLETLESWLWDSANIMRGHIDSSDFKNYIFGLLSLKCDTLLSRLLNHFNKHSLANVNLENPDILGNAYEQKKIAEVLSTTDGKLDNLKAKKEFFTELKKGLMQKLITGEMRGLIWLSINMIWS